MAFESQRKTHMVRITNPNDDTVFVDVKCIDQIGFVDPHEQGQEYVYRLNNTQVNASRKVHAATITGSDGSTVSVERIDQWECLIPQEVAQEERFRMIGNAQEPPVHFKTHVFRVTNPANPDIWVDVQRIDELSIVVPQEQAQEKIFTLQWPDDDMTNPSNVDTSSDGSSINPPWRLDPFQNIVGVSWGAGEDWAATAPHGFLDNIGNPDPRNYLYSMQGVAVSNGAGNVIVTPLPLCIAIPDGHGGFYVSVETIRGNTTDPYTGADGNMLRSYDSKGSQNWRAQAEFEPQPGSFPNDIACTLAGEVVIARTGATAGSRVIKVDTTGSTVWQNSYAAGTSAACCACDGDMTLYGIADAGGNSGTFYLVDPHGTVVWSHAVSGAATGCAVGNGVYIIAYSDSSSVANVEALEKDNGHTLWTTGITWPTYSVDCDEFGDVYAACTGVSNPTHVVKLSSHGGVLLWNYDVIDGPIGAAFTNIQSSRIGEAVGSGVHGSTSTGYALANIFKLDPHGALAYNVGAAGDQYPPGGGRNFTAPIKHSYRVPG
jgi:hypothetical protein